MLNDDPLPEDPVVPEFTVTECVCAPVVCVNARRTPPLADVSLNEPPGFSPVISAVEFPFVP